MPCPFLSRLGANYVRNYSEAILQVYGSYCPFMTKNFCTSTSPLLTQKVSALDEIRTPAAVNAKTSNSLENNNSKHFPYERFFHEQILKKKQDHSYRVFKKISRLGGAGMFPYALEYSDGEKPITIWCSNDYLGISCHSKVKEAVAKALEYHGAGAGGTRNISGNTIHHVNLESRVAELHQKEAGLVFTSCFVANDSTLYTLAKLLPNCHIFSDSGNHASMIQGIRNSNAPKHIFRHNDVNHLESLLQKVDKNVPKIVAFETVHSMTGDICPLEDLLDVSHEYGAITFIDEVHAVGLYGHHGAGIGEQRSLLHKMDIISGTLGKAFGNIGGYIVGSPNLIDMIRSYAAGFIFTTSLPPTVLCGALEAINILASDEGRELRWRHQNKVKYLKHLLQREGFPVEDTQSHIIPIKIGDPSQATQISNILLQQFGHYVQAINYPTVARGEEKLRLAPSPFHSYNMIDSLVSDMKKTWDSLGIPLHGPTCVTQCLFCNKLKMECNENLDDIIPIIKCSIPDCPRLVASA